MDPILKAVLLSWDWRMDILTTLALAGVLYTNGWWKLRKHTRPQVSREGKRPQISNRWLLGARWRPVVYLTGLLIIGISLMSPIDVLGGQLFTMHMIQHLLLIMMAPPLLILANPLPFVLWGLPGKIRPATGKKAGQILNQNAPFRVYLSKLTTPGLSWMYWVIVVIGWHDTNAYNAALRNAFIHDIEHLSFFFVGMLFWWHVIGAGPRIHKPFSRLSRIVFVLSAIPPNMFTGLAIAFAGEPIYAYATSFFGLSVLQDQQLGGVIMWIPGSMMYIVAALILIARYGQEEENKPHLPESTWGTEEQLVAPGFKK